jgi:hypothetical protein
MWTECFRHQLKKVRDYFVQTFERNKRICFDLDISCHNAATLFLHWLIKYWPEREYELNCNYSHSNFDRLLKLSVPLLDLFSNNEIKFGSLQERINNRKYFHKMIPEELKEVTLIADTTSFWIIK